MLHRFSLFHLVLALTPLAQGADFFTGVWKIESAVVAPWWHEQTPPDPAWTRDLIGKTMRIAPLSMEGPGLITCAAPRYAVKLYPADLLFQGNFGEMSRRDKSVHPARIAASLGFRGTRWKTLETGCENQLDFHFLNSRTGAFALDNYIYTIRKK